MVIDPFDGVALGALDAMFHGLHHIGCELEEKFVQLGQQNIDLWNRRYGGGKLRRWGTAVILQGDSRRLVEVLEGARAEGVISSPPFSPDQPCASQTQGLKDYHAFTRGDGTKRDHVMRSEGNLGNMPAGEPPQCILSSPPYATKTVHGKHGLKLDRFKEPGRVGKTSHAIGAHEMDDYGHTDGQLAAMREGEPPAGIVSSPPYHTGSLGQRGPAWFEREASGKYPPLSASLHHNGSYGKAEGQLDGMESNTFWSAARAILLQCHAVLAPGGVAIFVTKRFVRDKAIVEFSQQWADLCQSCGFELIEWIKAWLVEERGTQYGLTGEAHTKIVKRFSFFRRLHAQKYPHLAIEWEDVLIFRKPV